MHKKWIMCGTEDEIYNKLTDLHHDVMKVTQDSNKVQEIRIVNRGTHYDIYVTFDGDAPQ